MAKKRHMDDKRFKNALIKWLKENGFRHPQSKVHHKFKSVKVIHSPTDLEGITTNGIVFRFEVKGHYVNEKDKGAFIATYFDEAFEGVMNPNNTFYVIVRKEKKEFSTPLFFTIEQFLKLLALQKPTLKGVVKNVSKLTQKDVDEDNLHYPTRRSSTLVADKDMMLGLNKIYNKLSNNKIKSNVGVNMNNQSLLMDTILYGATLGNKEGVEALVNMYSNTKEVGDKSAASNKDAMINKKSYFTSDFIDANNEPTESIKDVMIKHFNKEDDVAKDISRFYSSKVATDLKDRGVKFVNTRLGKSAAERYHLKVSDVESYLN